MGTLEDKVAIITGSGRGIGRAVAELLAAEGARIVVNDLDEDVAKSAAAEIGNGAIAYCGNLTKPGSADELVDTAIQEFGRLDIVVNNAGYTLDGPIHKMTDQAFQDMLDIHTIVPFRVLRAAAPHLREPAKAERERGEEVFRKVVNVTSIAGTMGNAGQVNYSSAKAALVGLTKSLAKEWGQFRINVNAVAFGVVDTRLTAPKTSDTVIEVDGKSIPVGIPAAARDAFNALIALERPARTQEAAGGVAFLCTPWSNYVTGQVLNVSGGIQLGMVD